MSTKFNVSKISEQMMDHWRGLLDLRDKLQSLPVTKKLGDRLAKVCRELEEIDDELSETDLFGNR